MIESIIVLIISFFEIVFVKTRRSSRLKKGFKSISESSFMSANIDLLFMFTVIKNREKNIYYNEIFKFFNVTSKLKIKIVIYNLELIFNENYFYIFN